MSINSNHTINVQGLVSSSEGTICTSEFLSTLPRTFNVRVLFKGKRFFKPGMNFPLQILDDTNPWSDWVDNRVSNRDVALVNLVQFVSTSQPIGEDFERGVDVFFIPHEVKNGNNAGAETIRRVCGLTLDLDFDRAGRRFSHIEIMQECKRLNLPAPTSIVATGGGFHVRWAFSHGIYLGPRRNAQTSDLSVTERDAQLRSVAKRRQRICSWYSEVAGTLCQLFAEYGADERCTDIAHPFRLPGFASAKRGCMVKVVYLDPNARSELWQISEAIKQHGHSSTVKRCHIAPERSPEPCAFLLDLPGYRWLAENCFAVGHRNVAGHARRVIERCAGLTFEEAARRDTEWLQRQNREDYTASAALREIKSVYRRRHRKLSVRRLTQIVTAAGESMPRNWAIEIVTRLSGSACRPFEQTRPPIIDHITRIFEYLLSIGATSDLALSARAMAAGTGLSVQQVERSNNFFDRIGVRRTERRGSSMIGIWNLSLIRVSPQEVIKEIDGWRSYKAGLRAWLWTWWRRFRSVMIRFRSVLERLGALLRHSLAEFGTFQPAVSVEGGPKVMVERGPPLSMIENPESMRLAVMR